MAEPELLLVNAIEHAQARRYGHQPDVLAAALARLLRSPAIDCLIADLETTRWTGRPGYPLRALVGMALLRSLYGLRTWTSVVRLVNEHSDLQRILDCQGNTPSIDACYRFTKKLRDFTDLIYAIEDISKR